MKKLHMALCLLLCLCLCGCSAAPQSTPDVTLPPMQPGPAAPVGDTSLQYTATVPLYLPSRDGQTLLSFYQTLTFTAGAHPAEAILRALLSHPGNDRVASLGGEVELTLTGDDPAAICSGVCTVNLSASALLLSSEALHTVAQAITATLCQLDDVDYVNLLVAGAPPALDVSGNLPLGLLSPEPGMELPILWEQLNAKRPQVGTLASSAPVSATAMLYFPLADGSGIAAEVRRISFPGQHPQQLMVTLMEALSTGAFYMDNAAPMPQILPQLLFMPEAIELEGGGRRANLHFAADTIELLQDIGCDPVCFFAALTMTLVNFVPSLQQVCILLGNGALTSVPSEALGARLFPGALHTREHYMPLVMGEATLYLPGEEGLTALPISLHYKETRSPRALLKRLSDAGALPALTEADVLGVAIHDGTLLINLSDRVGEAIRSSPDDQRMMAYSAVTTLCDALDMRRVRFYFGGYALDSLDADLVWSGEFLYNPALGE